MPTLKRIGGVALIVISVVSLLFSLAALAGVWIVRKPFTDAMTVGLSLASDTLEVTGDTLDVLDDGLRSTSQVVAGVETTVSSLAVTLESTTPALETVGDLLGTTVPAALTAANVTIGAAQKSAETVDSVLTTLAGVPLLGINYTPEVPLSQALSDINTSLEALPGDLERLGGQITSSLEAMPTLASATTDLAGNIGELNATVEQSRLAVQDYQRLVVRYMAVVDFLKQITSIITFVVPLLISLLIFWIIVVQVETVWKGWRLARGEPVYGATVALPPQPALPPASEPAAGQIAAPADSTVYQNAAGGV